MIKLTTLLKESILREDDDFDLSDNPLSSEKSADYLNSKFSSQNSPIRLSAGRKYAKGIGKVYKIEDMATVKRSISKDVATYLRDDQQQENEREFFKTLEVFLTEASSIAKYFKITWTKIALFKEFTAYDYEVIDNSRYLRIEFGISGKDSLQQEFVYTTKDWSRRLFTSENKVELPYDFDFNSEEQMQGIKDELFTKTPPEPKRKRADINSLYQSPNATDVFLTHGRIKRGGFGVKSKYDKLEDYLTTYQLERIRDLAKVGEIKWDDMIIYYNGNSNNFAINGVDKDGDEVLYSYHGSGMGASTKFYKGSNVVYATEAEKLY